MSGTCCRHIVPMFARLMWCIIADAKVRHSQSRWEWWRLDDLLFLILFPFNSMDIRPMLTQCTLIRCRRTIHKMYDCVVCSLMYVMILLYWDRMEDCTGPVFLKPPIHLTLISHFFEPCGDHHFSLLLNCALAVDIVSHTHTHKRQMRYVALQIIFYSQHMPNIFLGRQLKNW